jgi:large repetitive protein
VADPVFTTVLSTHGGYITTAPRAIPDRRPAQIAISAWFKTTDHGGVLASLQNRPLTPGSTRNSGYAPLLYVGLDGHLRGLWPTGTAPDPLKSPGIVATGTWQHAMLTASTSRSRTTQRLYVNGRLVATRSTAAVNLAGLGPATNLTIAAGYLGGAWPSQPHRGLAHPDYFIGQLADITVTR